MILYNLPFTQFLKSDYIEEAGLLGCDRERVLFSTPLPHTTCSRVLWGYLWVLQSPPHLTGRLSSTVLLDSGKNTSSVSLILGEQSTLLLRRSPGLSGSPGPTGLPPPQPGWLPRGAHLGPRENRAPCIRH